MESLGEKAVHYVWLSQKEPQDVSRNQVLPYPISRLPVEMDGYKNTEIVTDVDHNSIRVDNEIEEASKYFII